jgi:predicted RNA-binding Zn-ribbon protein involved in translation (DUF1610 family)
MNIEETTSVGTEASSSVMEFEFPCPNCAQRLQCATEDVGAEVTCPICGGEFMIPPPSGSAPTLAEAPVSDQVKQWMADVRVLVLRSPPVYVKILIEVPKGWVLPPDGMLPEPAHEAVTKAVRAKFPHCPITPIRVRTAGAEALRRISDDSDYSNECCRVWLLGKGMWSPTPQPFA